MSDVGGVTVVVVSRHAFYRDALISALSSGEGSVNLLGAVETVELALDVPAEVVVLCLTDGTGIAVVHAEQLATWSGKHPQAVNAPIVDWTIEAADLVLLITRTAGGTLPAPPFESDPFSALTSRESEILGLLGAGWDAASIAGELGISGHTVRTHLARINEKLGVQSRLAAASVARQHGMISLREQGG